MHPDSYSDHPKKHNPLKALPYHASLSSNWAYLSQMSLIHYGLMHFHKL